MPPRQLSKNKRQESYATVAANGTATAVVDVVPGPSWEVIQIGVSVTGSSLIPTATSYIGRNSAGVFISSTPTGDSDTDSAPNVLLRTGDALCVVWESATPGARCKMTVVYNEVGY